MVTKVNPIFDAAQPRSFLGKSISVFDVTTAVDASGSTGPEGAIDAILKTVAARATIVAHSDVTATGLTVWLEGEYPDSDYNGDGSDESFASVMEAELQALGTVDSLDLSGTTVTAGPVFRADQV